MTARETRLDAILPTLATKADVAELRGDMEKRFLNIDTKFEELRRDMHKMNAEIKTWTLATMITIVGTMLAAIFGISQIYKGVTPASSSAQPVPIIINLPGSVVPAAPANSK